MIPFLLPSWWKLAASGAIVVVIAGGAWKLRHSGLVDGRTEVRAEWNAEKLASNENARLREQAALKNNERIDRDYQTQKARILADGLANADKLRDLQATLKPADNVTSTTPGINDPRDSIIDQCATALNSLDGYAKSVALTAIGLQRYTTEVCLAK